MKFYLLHISFRFLDEAMAEVAYIDAIINTTITLLDEKLIVNSKLALCWINWNV